MKLREIAEVIGAQLLGDGETEITGVGSLEEGGPNDICLYLGGKFKKHLETTASRTLVVAPGTAPGGFNLLVVERPRLRFIEVVKLFHPAEKRTGVHPSAFISPSAQVGEGVFLGAHACIGDGSRVGEGTEIHDNAVIYDRVSVGKDCLIYAGAVLREGTVVGDRCIIHAGAVVGADGFGFEPDEGKVFRKIPQVGKVVIEDDVEIGANSCIDRAALGETRVGRGTKIDNLCQLGHGVKVGMDTVISGMTGISGSVTIGNNVVIGGGVGIADHVTIGDGVIIAGRTGVTGNVPAGSVIAGAPHTDIRTWKRAMAILYGLPRRRKDSDAE